LHTTKYFYGVVVVIFFDSSIVSHIDNAEVMCGHCFEIV